MNPDSIDRLRLAFSETCDPDAYVPRPGTEAALGAVESWWDAADEGGRPSPAVAAIIGEPGLGKTFLLRLIEARHRAARAAVSTEGTSPADTSDASDTSIASHATVLYLPYAGIGPADLAYWVHGLLGRALAPDALSDPASVLASLEALGRSESGPFLLVIDDADGMPQETLRMLGERAAASGASTSVEGDDGEGARDRDVYPSRLRVLLGLGRDARANRLLAALHDARPTTVELRDRLSVDETRAYVSGRMQWAGVPEADAEAFDDETISRIHSLSAGLPRQIHALALQTIEYGQDSLPSALDEKRRREEWMGQPIDDEFTL